MIAEETNEIDPNIVIRNKEGEIETIQYHKLDGYYISVIQKLMDKVETLEAKVAALESTWNPGKMR